VAHESFFPALHVLLLLDHLLLGLDLAHLHLQLRLDAVQVLFQLDSGVHEAEAVLAFLRGEGETVKVAKGVIHHQLGVMGGARAAVVLVEYLVVGLQRREDLDHPIHARRLLLDQEARLPQVRVHGLAHWPVTNHNVPEHLGELKLLGRVSADLEPRDLTRVETPRAPVLDADEKLLGDDGVRVGWLDVLVADVVDVEALLVDDEALRLFDADLLYHQVITDNS